jgi:WD40 repeat protein
VKRNTYLILFYVILLFLIFSMPGMAGEADLQVFQVQQRLQALGFDPGSPDGIWGGRTRKALSAYQQAHRLPPTGEINPETLLKLRLIEDTSTPQVVVQLGHMTVNSVTLSSDSRFALSGGSDHTLKFWNVASGRLIRTFQGHSESVNAVAFSPDGRYVLSGSSDNTLKLWNLATGREIHTIQVPSMRVCAVAFSPDGRHVLSGNFDPWWGRKRNTLKLWEVATGREIRTFKGHSRGVFSVAFSPDGRFVLSGGGDKRMKLWDLRSGREIRAFQGHSNSVDAVAFSPDGRYALSGSLDNTLKLWDLRSGREIRTFKGHLKSVKSVVFSPDGRYILSGSSDHTVKIWNLASAQEIYTFKGHSNKVNTLALSRDGRFVISGSSDKTLKLWEIASGREIRTFKGRSEPIAAVAFSPDGRYTLSGGWDNTLILWDVASGRKIGAFKGHSGRITAAAFSPDSRYILSGSRDATLKLWRLDTKKEIHTFKGHSHHINAVAFSPDGRYALSGSNLSDDNKTLKLWDVNTGLQIRSYQGENVESAVFSPDGRYILSASWDRDTLKLWEAASGKELRTFQGHSRSVYAAAFSPDGRYALSGSRDNTLKLWNVATGLPIRTFKGHSESVRSVAFSPDGRFILSGSWDHTLRSWEVASGRLIHTFKGHSGPVSAVFVSPDSRFALSGSWDGTMRLWDVQSGHEVARMISCDTDEWITITPDGYYTASVRGDEYLNIRMGNTVTGIDPYRATFYKPNVVEAGLRLGDTQKAISEILGREKPTLSNLEAIEPPFIVIKSPDDGREMKSLKAHLLIYVEDRNQPLKWVKAYINGRQVTDSGGRGIGVAPEKQAELTKLSIIRISEGQRVLNVKLPIILDEGENLLEVVAFNGFSEARKAIRVHAVLKKDMLQPQVILPNLWILAIGINHYQDKRIQDLSYAVSDAHDIVGAFEQQEGKRFRRVYSRIISDKSKIAPTYENIVDNLDYLSRAGHRDFVLLFIAGHGINDDRGSFYFLPKDATFYSDGRIKKSRAIPWHQLKGILDLPARKLVLADTCHSEGLSGKKTRGVDNDRFVKELQDTNAVIFTSSRGNEISQEDDKWGHGAFSFAILQGLNGKADLRKDGKISMKELDTYVSETVPQITNGAQHPITFTPGGYSDFPLALLR